MARTIRSLILAAALVLLPGQSFAYNEFVLVRLLPSGNENVIQRYPYTDDALEQIIREDILTLGRGNKLASPGNRYVIYGPTEDPDAPYTIDDRVWDSAVDL